MVVGQPYVPAALYPPRRFLVLISVRGWVDRRAIVQLEGLGQLKKCSDLIKNWTGDLRACSLNQGNGNDCLISFYTNLYLLLLEIWWYAKMADFPSRNFILIRTCINVLFMLLNKKKTVQNHRLALHIVTINFTDWGHKKHTKKINMNTITQYSPCPLPHNVYITHTANQMPEKTLLPVLPSVFSSQSVGSMKQPQISSLSSEFLI
jgi:hypothetical protein